MYFCTRNNKGKRLPFFEINPFLSLPLILLKNQDPKEKSDAIWADIFFSFFSFSG